MNKALEKTILALLSSGRDMTIATIRPDGYPQATTVSFVNDGLALYFGCSESSQKARNIDRNDKVSLTVDLPYRAWNEITGLSVGGTARRVTDKEEIERVHALMLEKFPQIGEFGADSDKGIAIFRVTPRIISVLDYTKGFGHTDLVTL